MSLGLLKDKQTLLKVTWKTVSIFLSLKHYNSFFHFFISLVFVTCALFIPTHCMNKHCQLTALFAYVCDREGDGVKVEGLIILKANGGQSTKVKVQNAVS